MKILETHIVPAIQERIRLQEYAVDLFTALPTKNSLKKAIKKGLVLVDGQVTSTGQWVEKGQKLQLVEKVISKKIFRLEMEVLFEDDYIAVVRKPAGFPTSGNFFRTVENALPHNLKVSNKPDALSYPLPAHRLDGPTSGLLLCAKTRKCLIKLQEDFSQKKIQKIYHALCRGEISELLLVSVPIEGKSAITEVYPKKLYGISEKDYTLVKLIPLTGRTHQLRIHLSSIGHPIVGDREYGVEETGLFKGRSLFLFATKISFEHPVERRRITLSINLPKKLRKLQEHRSH